MNEPIFYHEDFYRQIELIPQENYFKVISDISSNGTADMTECGFITIKEREEPKIKTGSLKIHINAVKQVLAPFITKYFKEVTTGYGATVKLKPKTIAFGFERIALFFELNHTDIVTNIWMCQSTILPKANNPKNLLSALVALGVHFNLILVDWNEEVIVRLNLGKLVQDYLTQAFSFNFLSQ